MKKQKKIPTPSTRDKKIRELVIEELEIPKGGKPSVCRPCQCLCTCKCFVICVCPCDERR